MSSPTKHVGQDLSLTVTLLIRDQQRAVKNNCRGRVSRPLGRVRLRVVFHYFGNGFLIIVSGKGDRYHDKIYQVRVDVKMVIGSTGV